MSYRAEFDQAVSAGLRRGASAPPLTEADGAHLPAIVRGYLRLAGAIGAPRVRNVRARWRGRIRSGPRARWMPFRAEQYNFCDEPGRFFLMDATMFGIPVQAFHSFIGPSATMRVKVASLVTIVDAKGPAMDQGETVTLFNDLCVLAPGALVAPSITWDPVDATTVRAQFTNAGRTVAAVLSFNAAGELANFVSDDRLAASPDGKTFTPTRWSTPLSDYRTFGGHRLPGRGEARWHPAGGAFAYGEFELVAIDYNVGVTASRDSAADPLT